MEQYYVMDPNVASPVIPHGYVVPIKQEVPAPSSQTDPLRECNMFMSGYSDCAEEAIRFLTEDEGLPFHHPLVMGLFEHLSEQRKYIYLEYLLRSSAQLYMGVSAGNGSANIQSETGTGEWSNGSSSNGSANIQNETINADGSSSLEQISQNDTHNNDQNTPAMTCSQTVDKVVCVDNVSNELCSLPEHQKRLATEIAEEIFSLLQSDFYSDDELVDEGFEESCEP